MFRFSAGEEEISALLKFLQQRAPGGILMVPLLAIHRDDLRIRTTARPLTERILRNDTGITWGCATRAYPPEQIMVGRDSVTRRYIVNPELSHLILLDFGPPQGKSRRREAVIETRDWTHPDAPEDLAPASHAARKLVEKCARRLRRRGFFDGFRWQIP